MLVYLYVSSGSSPPDEVCCRGRSLILPCTRPCLSVTILDGRSNSCLMSTAPISIRTNIILAIFSSFMQLFYSSYTHLVVHLRFHFCKNNTSFPFVINRLFSKKLILWNRGIDEDMNGLMHYVWLITFLHKVKEAQRHVSSWRIVLKKLHLMKITKKMLQYDKDFILWISLFNLLKHFFLPM